MESPLVRDRLSAALTQVAVITSTFVREESFYHLQLNRR